MLASNIVALNLLCWYLHTKIPILDEISLQVFSPKLQKNTLIMLTFSKPIGNWQNVLKLLVEFSSLWSCWCLCDIFCCQCLFAKLVECVPGFVLSIHESFIWAPALSECCVNKHMWKKHCYTKILNSSIHTFKFCDHCLNSSSHYEYVLLWSLLLLNRWTTACSEAVFLFSFDCCKRVLLRQDNSLAWSVAH